jgi:DNA-binding transcriptional ArsR family regulator
MEPADRRDRRWCLEAALARHAGDDVAALRLAGDLAAFLANGTQFGPLLGVETPAGGETEVAGGAGEPGKQKSEVRSQETELSPPLAETLAALRNSDRYEGVRAGDIAEATGAAVETTRYRLRKLRDAGLARLKGKTVKARWFAVGAAVKPPLMQKPLSAAQAMRKCLGGCGKQFLSAGKGNRICPGCAVKNSKRAGGVDDAAGVII